MEISLSIILGMAILTGVGFAIFFHFEDKKIANEKLNKKTT